MRKKAILFSVTAAAALAASGCSSIQHGTYEKIEIVSEPAGAWCKIYREGDGFLKSITTPGERYIKRSTSPLQIVCSKDGYKTMTVTHAPEFHNDNIGNVSTIGLGQLFDSANAGNYEQPERFEITLERE